MKNQVFPVNDDIINNVDDLGEWDALINLELTLED